MIDSRLRQVMSQLKEDIRIPIIVELATAPTPAAVQELTGAGLRATTTSKISPLVYGTATSNIIQVINANPIVTKVFYDEPLYPALALPFGVEVELQEVVPLGESVGATGAPELWNQGITGAGVGVGVIDTGTSQSHEMISPGLKDTFSAVPGESVEDENHHGCLSGDTIIITDEHGVTTLEELWDTTDIGTTPQNGGEVKSFSGHTIGMNGVTSVSALYRTHADEVAIIDTGYGIVKSTVWHKFFVAVPRKDPNRTNRAGKKDTHPRWYHGYDVIEKRADELKQGDCLVCAKYSGTNDKLWNNNIDPKIAYIAGLVFGDGTILTGYMYKRYRKEIRIFDNDLEALQSVKKIVEELGATAGIYGKENAYVLNTYGDLAHIIKDLQFNDVCNGLESIKAWVAGFFDAEGYVSKREKAVVFSNTDLDMLVRLNDIFKLVGLRSYINSGGVSKGSQGWHLCVTTVDKFTNFVIDYSIKKRDELLNADTAKFSRNHVKIRSDGSILAVVKDITIEKTDEKFYDITTESHNYSANGIIVHNSWCCSAAAGRPVSTEHGELVGAAPGADLYALKALSDKGTGQMSWVMQCIEKATLDFKCDVISMSLGSLFDNGGLDPVSKLVNDVVQKYNILCVVAAGNSFIPLSIGSPGGAIAAITVGSYALRLPLAGTPSSFESKGPTTSLVLKPDTSAPGGNIMAPGISEMILAAGAHGSYQSMAGTSMATPQAAGALALLRQIKPGLSRAEVEQLLAISSFPIPKDTLRGYGPIRVDTMYRNLGKATLPITELQAPLNVIQSAIYAPFTLIPRPENERLKTVRLPAIMGG